ncbi:MAG: rhodanese-like domain-containing protein [Ignavibacteria bacterium]|nr:rhodanese-like domain-containing protein [Ignavibacteria bacterium]
MLNFLKNMMGGGSDDVAEALRNGAIVIDVRTPAEFSGGHVAGSKNVPLNELPNKLGSMPTSKPIVFCCASGGRSGSATGLASSKATRPSMEVRGRP